MKFFNAKGNLDSQITILGASADFGSTGLAGCKIAPEVLRTLSNVTNCDAIFCTEKERNLFNITSVNDLGIMKYSAGTKQDAYLNGIKLVSNEATKKSKLITIGGDHLISLPVIEGVTNNHKNLQVLHIDAHFDQNPIDKNSIPSHNNFVSYLIESENIKKWVFVGQRGLSGSVYRKTKNTKLVRSKINQVPHLLEVESPVYITIDLDALDLREFSSVSFPQPGDGISINDLISTVQCLKDNNFNIVGIDFCEYNPTLDNVVHKDGRILIHLIANIISILISE